MIQLNCTTTLNKSKTKSKENLSIQSFGISLLIILIMILIVLDPTTYAKSIVKGLTLFYSRVLPGLLPFMFLVKLLTNQNLINRLCLPLKKTSLKLFGTNEHGLYSFLMSTISGYPIGAKITSDLCSKNKINQQQLLKTAILSSTPGLIFVIGSVGGLMLSNVKLGIFIYIINIISCLVTSCIINIFSKNQSEINTNINSFYEEQQSLGKITQDTTISLLSVGFYIAIFTLIIDLLTNLNVFGVVSTFFGLNQENSELLTGVMSGIIEMTNGVNILKNNLNPLSLSFITSIISFSGASIIMQSLSFLSNTHIKPSKFILGKFLQALTSFFLSFLICSIFNII